MLRRFEVQRRGIIAVLAAALCLVTSSALQAQTTSASVQGIVADSQAGVLPGVTVTLTSKSQSEVFTSITDGEGRFVFPVVRPDSYILKATLEGFKTLEQTNLVVNAADKLSAGTLTMEVGALTESISVSARVTELQANSGERSFAMESTTLTNVANNGRAMFNFATLVPGVVGTQNAAGNEIGSIAGISVNGQRSNTNNLTIDGVANIDTGNNGGNMATTSIDSVAEFKVLTNAYQAEYGRSVGALVQVVTKSGSNEFHGSGYWYARRSEWNAVNWFNRRDNIKPAKSSRDDRGYTVGGPVLKRKVFFFWSQEFQKRSDPVNVRFATVPTALERAGDFSQSVDSSGIPFPYIRDYTTGLPCSATDTRGCFADGGVLGKIPASRLYALGLNILKLYPAANGSFGSGQNYQSAVPNSAPRREDMIRMDYQVTDRWRMTGRFMNTKEEIELAYGATWAGNGSDQLPTPVTFLHPGRNWMVSTQGILSNTMSLEASVGQASNSLNYDLQLDSLYRANSGLSSFPYLYPNAVQADYIPQFEFRGGRTSRAGQYHTNNGPFTNENKTTDVNLNVTKVLGSHTAKAGIYYQHSLKPQSIFFPFNATVSFTDNASNPFDTGYSYANAATGVYNTYTQANRYAVPNWVYDNYEWFVQDNWKLGRLTLDYGVRFYYMTPQWDDSKIVSNFLPDKFDFANAAKLYSPVCIGAYPCSGNNRRGMSPALIASGAVPSLANTVESRFIGRLVPGSNRFNGAFTAGSGISDTVQSGNVFEISPRVGVVYDISGTGTTIVRGGWGIFYDRPMGNIVFDMGGNAPATLNSASTWGLLSGIGGAASSSDPSPTLGLNPTAYDFTAPRVQQWNIGIQRKLPMNMVFDLAYVGSHSDRQVRRRQINSVPLGAAFLPSNQDATQSASTTPGATALANDLMRPYQGYGNINVFGYDGWSNYHGLQTGITRRFDQNYMFSVFYVYGKSLTTNGDDNAGGNYPFSTDPDVIEQYDYSLSNVDRRHNFVLNAIYRTPTFTQNKAAGIFVNDWQVSGIYRFTGGQPYGIGYNISGYGSRNLTGSDYGPRIVVTCDPGSGSSSDPYKQFNTACFQAPSVGSKGGESERLFMHLPPLNNVDLSLSKRFPLVRGTAFEIRIDAFNALNTTQFTGIHSTANFAGPGSTTITNLPYNSSGQLVNKSGFGAVSGVNNARVFQVVGRFTF